MVVAAERSGPPLAVGRPSTPRRPEPPRSAARADRRRFSSAVARCKVLPSPSQVYEGRLSAAAAAGCPRLPIPLARLLALLEGQLPLLLLLRVATHPPSSRPHALERMPATCPLRALGVGPFAKPGGADDAAPRPTACSGGGGAEVSTAVGSGPAGSSAGGDGDGSGSGSGSGSAGGGALTASARCPFASTFGRLGG
eukprot:352743-Chlamydomonas_euryale.AAC.19